MGLFKIMIKEIIIHKFKFLLVYLSILLTIILLLGYNSFEKSIIATRMNQLRDETLNSQILIESDSNDMALFNAQNIIQKIKKTDNVQNVISRCSCTVNVNLNTDELYLYGVDIEAQNKIYPFSLLHGTINFKEKNGIIISDEFANKNNLKINDRIEISIDEKATVLLVKAIVEDNAFFNYDDKTVVCKLEKVQQIMGTTNLVNRLDITISDLSKIEKTTENLNIILKDYHLVANSKYQTSFYDSYVKTIELALKLFLIFIIIISIYISYSIFNQYVYENASQMAIFRSIGFSINDYKKIVLGEMSILVVLGIVSGWILSYPCLKALMDKFIQSNSVISYDFIKSIFLCIIVYCVSLISVLIAIHRVINIPITVLLRKKGLWGRDKSHMRKYISAIVLIILGLYFYFNNFVGVLSYYLSIILMILGFILIYEKIAVCYAWFVHKIFLLFVKRIGIIAKQIEIKIESYFQIMIIISMVLTIFTLTISISYAVKDTLSSVYNGADIMISGEDKDLKKVKNFLNKESRIKTYTVQLLKSVVISKGTNSELDIQISGIEVDSYALEDYEKVIGKDRLEVFGKLNEDNTIIVTTTVLKNQNKKVGDTLLIENNKFKIVGAVRSFENMGMKAYISKKNFDSIYNSYDSFLTLISVNKDDIVQIYEKLSERLSEDTNCSVNEIENIFRESWKQNQMIIYVIYILCILSFFISLIGLANTLTIIMMLDMPTFIIYRTIGFNRKDIYIMKIVESMLMATFSGVIGVIMGIFLVPEISQILSYYVGDLNISIQIGILFNIFVITCVVILFVTVFVIKKYVLNDSYMQQIKKYC